MKHLAEHHYRLLIEESGAALNVAEARDYRMISKRVELKELEKLFHLARRKIAVELTGIFLSGVEKVSRRSLVAKCHASRKVVAS